MVKIFALCFVLLGVLESSLSQYNNNFKGKRNTIVNLFEWKWNDIARECEDYLGPKGFGGVETSPPFENLALESRGRPWWERYQPISYKLITRSGNEAEFADMVRRCNAVDVGIYPDTLLNHMTGTWSENVGTGGSTADFANWDYPGVPYTKEDFNSPICAVEDYDNATEVRNCELYGLKDLKQAGEHTKAMIVEVMNKLVDIGVAGFFINDAKYMWPEDLAAIYENINNLSTAHGFPEGARPYLYHSITDLEDVEEAVTREEYTPLGAITEFRAGDELGKCFRKRVGLHRLINFGERLGLAKSSESLIFVDEHDNQRGAPHGESDDTVTLTYKTPKIYKGAIAYMLGHGYGATTRIISSFAFDDIEAGPPMDADQNIISPVINADGSCDDAWVCEHRWTSTAGMVGFRSVTEGEDIFQWWVNGYNQISLCKGFKGFLVFNMEPFDLSRTLGTCLPAGTYCDVITGVKNGTTCTGKSVVVDEQGDAFIEILASADDGVLAIHVDSKLD